MRPASNRRKLSLSLACGCTMALMLAQLPAYGWQEADTPPARTSEGQADEAPPDSGSTDPGTTVFIPPGPDASSPDPASAPSPDPAPAPAIEPEAVAAHHSGPWPGPEDSTLLSFSGVYTPQDDDERGLWMQVDDLEKELKPSDFIIRDPDLNDYVKGVLCRLVGTQRCDNVRLYIVRTPHFNASMYPNGMMHVWSGLLLRVRNEAQLATVLGHEYGHFDRKHSLQNFRSIRAKTDAMVFMAMIPYGVGLLAQYGILGSIFSFNRDMEKEADIISLKLMQQAGYDTDEAAKVWQNLRDEQDATAAERNIKSRKDKNGGFFASHPNTADRRDYLMALSKENAHGSDKGRTAFDKVMNNWWPRLIDDQIKLNDFGATEYLLAQLAQDGWSGELLFARGELYRHRGQPGDYEKAAEFYRQSIDTGIELEENWRGLGLAQLRSGQREMGRTSLRHYLDIRPDAPDYAMLAMMAGRDPNQGRVSITGEKEGPKP